MGELRLRRGRVSSLDRDRGLVRVAFINDGGDVSDFYPLLAFEYNMPSIGDFVAVIEDNNGGVVLGRIWSNEQKPEDSGNDYEKDIEGVEIRKSGNEFSLEFSGGIVRISANKIILDGYEKD